MFGVQLLARLSLSRQVAEYGRRSSFRREEYRPQVEGLEARCLPSTVTTLADAGPGSLRNAIATTPADGTVDFQPGLTGTITLTSGTLTLDHSLTITGPGAKGLTVSGNRQFTVVNVSPGVTATLAGLTISDGHGTTGLTVSGGGGINNQGTLTVTGCLLSNNQDVNGHDAAYGGGIFNTGTLTVVASTLTHNTALYAGGPFGPPSSVGGGIYNAAGATLTVVNSTLSGNTTSASASIGGGIANAGSLTIISSTVSLNSVTGDSFAKGGGISNSSTLNLLNTLVAGNTATGITNSAPDVDGAVSQADHNLIGIGDGSTGLVNGQNGNQVGTTANPIDPKLGPLQDNGGPMPTLALLPGSPAIDAGNNGASPGPTDQRGFPRIAGGTIDIGAYELQALPQGSRIFAVGGAPGRVQVRRGSDGALMTDFTPYGPAYTGGVAVAIGDVNGDGFPDLVTAPLAGNPQVKVYDGKAIATGSFNPGNPDASLLTSFFAYGINFNIGANLAVGDISGDGFADIVTGATAGNPQVKVYDGKAIAQHTFDPGNPDASLLASFFAYGINFNIGANVAVGDVNHDGFADLVTGATAGNPHVKVYDGKAIAQHTFNGGNPDASLLAQFFAFGLQFNIGAFVSVGDVTGNGFGDVIVGAAAGNPQVKVYDGQAIANHSFNGGNPDASLLATFFAYGLNFNIGASVSAAAFDVSGPADILTGAAQGAPHYRLVRGLASGVQPPAEHGIDAIAADLTGGIRVGA
jgi:hypothetical protein